MKDAFYDTNKPFISLNLNDKLQRKQKSWIYFHEVIKCSYIATYSFEYFKNVIKCWAGDLTFIRTMM